MDVPVPAGIPSDYRQIDLSNPAATSIGRATFFPSNQRPGSWLLGHQPGRSTPIAGMAACLGACIGAPVNGRALGRLQAAYTDGEIFILRIEGLYHRLNNDLQPVN